MVLVQLGLAAASYAASSSAARRAKKQAKRDLAFQKQQLAADTRDASALALEGGLAAAAPLNREADLMRTGANVRNPLLEAALTTAVRGQGEAQTQRAASASTSLSPGRMKEGVLGRLFQGQALLAKEGQRSERFRQNAAVRGQLLAQAGEFTKSGFQSAASIRAQGATALAGLPSGVPSGPSPLVGALGGLTEAYGALSDDQQGEIEGKLKEFIGLGGTEALEQTALGTTQFNELSAAGKLPAGQLKVMPDTFLDDMLAKLQSSFGFLDRPSASPSRLSPPFRL